MYSDKLVACIKVNGRILRENKGNVLLPFGCEYSILVKNLDSVRQQVNISVDGKMAGDNLIIAPNSSLELERFIRNGNLESGNRFKFIERTAGIESHRGIGGDDGIVRVEAWREKVAQVVDETIVRKHYYDDWYPVPRPYPVRPWPPYPRPHPYCGIHGSSRPMSRPGTPHAAASGSSRKLTPTRSRSIPGADRADRSHRRVEHGVVGPAEASIGLSDIGITVPGSESNQKFQLVSGFPLYAQSTVIVLHLLGELGVKTVSRPVTVNTKPRCETCGKSNKGTAQFCSQCGTALVLV